jgi:hypothetical protein
MLDLMRAHVPSRVKHGRQLEDELSFWFGPVFVKVLRILVTLGLSIHMSCCGFWRVKVSF